MTTVLEKFVCVCSCQNGLENICDTFTLRNNDALEQILVKAIELSIGEYVVSMYAYILCNCMYACTCVRACVQLYFVYIRLCIHGQYVTVTECCMCSSIQFTYRCDLMLISW